MLMATKYGLLFFVFVLLQSCGADKTSLLARTWKISELKYSREVPEAMRASIQTEIDRLKSGYTITYNADKTYQALMDGAATSGKWSLNFNSSKITSTGPDGKAVEYRILELSDARFSFEAIEGGEKVIFVMVPAQ